MGVQELLAVADQQVLGYGVDPAVDTPCVLDLLDTEGHEGCCGLSGQGAGGGDRPQAIGQGGVQAVLLLVAEDGEIAEGLGQEGFGVGVELFQRVSHVQQGHIGVDHALIPGAQIIQELLGLRPLLFQLIGNHSGEVVPGVLPLLPAGNIALNPHDLGLHVPHRFVGRDGEQVDGQYQWPGEVGQTGDHVVLDVTGVIPHEQNPAHFAAQFEVIRQKLHPVRRDAVLKAAAQAHGLPQVKLVELFLAGAEKIVEDPQPLIGVQCFCPAVQTAQIFG